MYTSVGSLMNFASILLIITMIMRILVLIIMMMIMTKPRKIAKIQRPTVSSLTLIVVVLLKSDMKASLLFFQISFVSLEPDLTGTHENVA